MESDNDITIAVESPLQDEVRDLIRDLNAYLNPLSPDEFQFQMSAEEMAEPSVKVLIARDASKQAVGMASLNVKDDELGEVKRMYTLPEARGKRIGSLMLERIEQLAGQAGLSILKLETGAVSGFESAWRLYERNGFSQCGAFLDYPDSGYSRFYEKKLEA